MLPNTGPLMAEVFVAELAELPAEQPPDHQGIEILTHSATPGVTWGRVDILLICLGRLLSASQGCVGPCFVSMLQMGPHVCHPPAHLARAYSHEEVPNLLRHEAGLQQTLQFLPRFLSPEQARLLPELGEA